MNLKELMFYTSLKRSFIYKRIDSNTIPIIRIDGRILFDVIQIDEWLQNGGSFSIDLPKLPN